MKRIHKFAARGSSSHASLRDQACFRNTHAPSPVRRGRRFQCRERLLPSVHIRLLHLRRRSRSRRRRTTSLATMSSRSDSHFIQQVVALTPIGFYFHELFEMTAMAQKLLDFVASPYPDLLQLLRAMANDDFLLRRAFYNNRAVNPREIRAHLFPFFRDHGGDIRKFFAG